MLRTPVGETNALPLTPQQTTLNYSSLLAQLSFYSPQRSLPENFYFRLNLNRSDVSNNGCLSHCVLITNQVLKYLDLCMNVSAAPFKNELLYVLNYKL